MPRKKAEAAELESAQEETTKNEENTEVPATSDVDLGDLLESMDDEQESTETTSETAESTDTPPFEPEPTNEPPPEKPKRATRKKKEPDTKPESDIDKTNTVELDDSSVNDVDDTATTPLIEKPAPRRSAPPPVLTIESNAELETDENLEEAAWHEIRNAYRTRKILTGYLGGIERTETGKTIAIVSYNDFRVVIPMKEMMINLNRNPSGQEYDDLMLRQNKILGNMLGAEIDFIVKGIESKSRSIVASRKDAMLKKRQLFYTNTDPKGMYRIYDGRIVQARVIAVADKVIRVEAFGVECSIMARDMSWDWIGDAHERFSVGDEVLVRILKVNNRESIDELSIKADIKSVSDNTSYENLQKCRIQSKYAGKITDVHKGVVYIRLSNGANAIAHSCYDRRAPGKKDDVSFAVTHIDEERGVAVGIITRIIKQNL